MKLIFYCVVYLIPASLFIYMAGMIYSNNRHSAKHITCSLLYAFTSLWFFGVFTSLIVYPDFFYEIIIYWVNGAITSGALLSLHLWLLTANMYEKKNGKLLKLLFVPGILLLLTMPIDSWMWRGEAYSEERIFLPGPGLYLLWLIDFLYLFINFVIIVMEMRKGSNAAKLWFNGLMVYFVWTISMLTAALTFPDTHFFFYFIPHGSFFWAIGIFLSIYRFDYLASYEKRYQILFNRSPLGILIMDKDAIVLEASPQVSRYLGVERQELVQSSILPLLGGINKQRFMIEHREVFEKQLKLENVEITFVNKLRERKTIVLDSDFIVVEGRKLQFVMVKDITEAKVKEEKVQYLAYHDILTGLSNRAAFEKRIKHLLRKGEEFNFLLLDLNKLKQINDTHGHQVGDKVIQHIANVLKEATEVNHHVARLGGDEFVLLLGAEEAKETIIKIQKKLETPLKLPNDDSIRLSVSIGVSHYPIDGDTIAQLYSIADKRMYEDKNKEA
ncbi:GGDEF domain-containing protein [Gracilibacillus xinjiangensis]|uniref:GGDEF domain-containing protein n=1 Tax=Gracilibacillus xinjiangensis TaxID=1193282 RepID=A0ABV8WU41_9BACI